MQGEAASRHEAQRSLFSCAEKGDLRLLKAAPVFRGGPNERNFCDGSGGYTALMAAVVGGHSVCVEELILAGARPGDKDRCGFGETALMKAASVGSADCLRVLVAGGAGTEDTNSQGWTALMFAAAHGNDVCVRLLVSLGAEVDSKNIDGETACLIATRRGKRSVSEFIAGVSSSKREAAALLGEMSGGFGKKEAFGL